MLVIGPPTLLYDAIVRKTIDICHQSHMLAALGYGSDNDVSTCDNKLRCDQKCGPCCFTTRVQNAIYRDVDVRFNGVVGQGHLSHRIALSRRPSVFPPLQNLALA